jgi:thioredoxin reductase (NADPH)
MHDQDVIVIGGGPAGLAAATELAARKFRALVLEREDFGGQLKKAAWFRGHPNYPQGVAGPELAERLLAAAQAAGVRLEYGEVESIESFSSAYSVTCVNGSNYLAPHIILAGGRRRLPLGIPGEAEFLNRGVIHCVLCDAGLYAGQTVAVCGGGDAGLSEALTLAQAGARVIVIERTSALKAGTGLQAEARSAHNIEFLFDTVPERIDGKHVVESLSVCNIISGARRELALAGIVVAVGTVPPTAWLDDLVTLDISGAVIVDERMATSNARIYAVGDIRGNSDLNLAGAQRDGATVSGTLQE